MAQIRLDNLCGPLIGPLLSLGMGFGFPDMRFHGGVRAAVWSRMRSPVNPAGVTFR
jgi:hypothetical protein